jgi:hypothetical protein
MGGDKLASLKTVVAIGRTRRVRGNDLVPIGGCLANHRACPTRSRDTG